MRKLIEMLAFAQIASTRGKHKTELVLEEALEGRKELVSCREDEYSAKDKNIRSALKYCAKNKLHGVHWTVTSCTDAKPKYIVYFRFCVNGSSYQVSFHSYDEWLKPWLYCGGNTRWLGKSHNGKRRADDAFLDSSVALAELLRIIPELKG